MWAMWGLPVVVYLVLNVLMLPASAYGQVYRCKDAAGKTIYTDAPCPTGQLGYLIEPAKTPEDILEERLQAAQANERKYRAQAAEQEAKILEWQQRQPYPIHAPEIQPTLAHPSASPACQQAKKELEFVSAMRTLSADEQRVRFNAAIARANIDCGTQTELIQEPVQKSVHRHVVPATVPRRPPSLPPPYTTPCKSVGCEEKPSGTFQRAK